MLPRRQTCRFPGAGNACSGGGGMGPRGHPTGGNGTTRPPCNVSGSARPQAPVVRSMRDGGLNKARHDALAGRHRHAGNT